MDIYDLVLGIIALSCTITIAIIPLRHDIYDKTAKRYTKPGIWFIGFAIIALISGITLQARTYIESVQSTEENSQERKALHKQIDSLGHHLDSLSNSRQRHLDQGAKTRLIQRINDSLQSHGLPATAEISLGYTMGNEEAMNFSLEVANFLHANGYNVNRVVGPTMGNEGKGFWLLINNGKLSIDVGVASHNGYP